ncbi:MAG: phosphoesterase [Firmicutes bacterium]|nr:phosphoesterase [Bacillota bacterium]
MIPARDRIIDVIQETIIKGGSIGIYPHVGADGDALGSAIGLALALHEAGAEARVFVDERVTPRLSFLPALDCVTVYADLDTQDWPLGQTLAIAVDCTEPERLGCRQGLYLDAITQAALDHHVSSGESGGLRMIDPEAAATGEIIADLIAELERRLAKTLLTRDAAMALMTAIISDTGGFVYSNTSARSFTTAAYLMTFEPDLRLITYRLFHETTAARLRLTGRMFTDAQFVENGRLVYSRADQALLQSLQATDNDLDGIIAELRNVAGVEVAFLFRELVDGAVRVNIRSNEHFHAADFAKQFGGGGHARAAGMTLRDHDLDTVISRVLSQSGHWLNGGT